MRICITGADTGGEEESLVWGILCNECTAKAEALIEARQALSLFDIPMEEYGFCSLCADGITEAFDMLERLVKGYGGNPHFFSHDN